MARAVGGVFLIRIEDIDRTRCDPAFEAAALADLDRLGIVSDGPIRRQSEHMADYAAALERLKAMGLAYPAFLSRAEIKRAVEARERDGCRWPRDPDGVPLYIGNEREMTADAAAMRMARGDQTIWRLHMDRAIDRVGPLSWCESGGGDPNGTADLAALAGRRIFRTVAADPAAWGDVILARADVPTSYHLSVVVDDALQGVTDVVRGADLFAATAVHRLLQTLLGLPEPRYHHHALVRDEGGRKLAKSDGDAGLGLLLDQGASRADIMRGGGLVS